MSRLDDALHTHFPQLQQFLPGQREALEAILDGRDVIAVLPTGGGKTLVYQLSGLMLQGTTVIATPLIALMQDQVRRLVEDQPDDEDPDPTLRSQEVASLTGAVRGEEREQLLRDLREGRLEFLFSTPEQLSRDDVRAALQESKIDLFCIDEAHCISEWGYDFRPAYRDLALAAEIMGRPPILALTATATEAVRRDVAVELGLDDPLVVARGFDRPNLHFAVERVPDPERRGRRLVRLLTEDVGSPAVVYCATRREAEETALVLLEHGVAAGHYHGGMERKLREEVQAAFLAGETDVLCATNAFGMGIDKRDLRAVIHFTMPDSLESYWQEAGRAGRDGHPSDCVLYFRPEDRTVHEHLHRRSRPSEGSVAKMVHAYSRLSSWTAEGAALPEVAKAASVARAGAASLLEDLERHGHLERRDGQVRFVGDPKEAMEAMAELRVHQIDIEASRLDMMAAYAESTSCRRRYLLNYLGDEYPAELCLRCDNCLRLAAEVAPEDWELERQEERVERDRSGPFDPGASVVHPEWGTGVVQRIDRDVMVVLFEEVGYRSMHGPTVRERGLLTPAG